jgi:transcriptional regulator with XRE-family HTH domain
VALLWPRPSSAPDLVRPRTPAFAGEEGQDGRGPGAARDGLPPAVRELAGRSGVSHNTITTLENRRRTANPPTVRKLAAALDVEPRELMGRDGG